MASNHNSFRRAAARYITPSGDRFHVRLSPVLGEDGSITLAVSGKDDIQQIIDSRRDSTDMVIIRRRLLQGDPNVMGELALRSDLGVYGDFSNLPTSYAEVLQSQIDARSQFDSLPLDVKQRFGSSFERWFSSILSPEWIELMGFDTPFSPDPALKEVSTDES